MAHQPQHEARTYFKTPHYDGQGEVEYFIHQFRSVVDTNQWNAGAAFLHLQEALKVGAQDCGQPETLAEIYAALRARYGLSLREARARLTTLKKEFRTLLQKHASAVQCLVGLAYADLPCQHQTNMALETFTNTLGNA